MVPGTPVGRLFLGAIRSLGSCPMGVITRCSTKHLWFIEKGSVSALYIPYRRKPSKGSMSRGVKRSQEEASAARLTFELNQNQHRTKRENALRQELREIRFEEHLSFASTTPVQPIGARRGSSLVITKPACKLLKANAPMLLLLVC